MGTMDTAVTRASLEGRGLTDKRALWERILALRHELYQAAIHTDSLTSDQVLEMSAELDRLILAYMEPGHPREAQEAST